MRLSFLRYLLLIDAAVLILLASLFLFAPRQVERAFGFHDLPAAVSYIIGLWGCVLGTLAIGYVAAAQNPVRHRIWIQVGIARGALECLLGFVYLARGIVSFQQAAFGIIVAACISIAYLVLYPRRPRLVAAQTASAPAK
jgi:hypothetical protein